MPWNTFRAYRQTSVSQCLPALLPAALLQNDFRRFLQSDSHMHIKSHFPESGFGILHTDFCIAVSVFSGSDQTALSHQTEYWFPEP